MNRRGFLGSLLRAATAGALASATRFLPMPAVPEHRLLSRWRALQEQRDYDRAMGDFAKLMQPDALARVMLPGCTAPTRKWFSLPSYGVSPGQQALIDVGVLQRRAGGGVQWPT